LETPKTNSVPPSEAFLVIFVTFCLSVIIGVALILTVGEAPALVIGELLILVVPLVYLMLKHINIKTYVKIDLKPKYILLGIAFGVLLLLLNVVVSGLLTTVFGTSKAIEDSNTLLTNLSGSTSGIIAVIASLSLAGICEEFAFRGLLQNSLTQRYSFLPAAIISAFVFGLFHFDPQLVYILAAFTSGLALGYIYHRWNYVTAATAHSMMNIIVLIFLLLGI
jgi:membrane protease YdiL (CAAX protease family)